ncbi:flagellar biosynthetic protein FliO [Permianibacter sp. IMCC34836]|uniref:flagellar biosynthetic protein FliO n=1 Tax=Permianibacter fluminis TaxID=2738515 RepID=UPI0015525E58|nr:flagellar biosynthetic protein FliO [Permianibacter fluminis]NQD38027.1 flagellar biosynthetic protein FliO [Permianibacter fluminis]
MNVSKNCAKAGARLALLLLSPASAWAAEASEAAVPSVSRLVFGLFAVLGLLMICAWVLRRGGLTGHTGLIKVVSQCAVGTRERVVLVQVGDQQLLIGVTPQQISLLHTLAQPVAAPAVPASNKFAEQLALLMKGQRPS